MDTISHGIAGALLGKGFFAERHGRIAVWALTLGSVFPDGDVLYDVASRDPLALLKYHRSITHSWLALPFFAAALAWLTRGYARRRGLPSPTLAMLTLLYAMGIGGHILVDALTSFGTMVWFPITRGRVAWDWLFIVDLAFTAILLLPQVAAWVYSAPESVGHRAARMWMVFSLCAAGFYWLGRLIGAAFSALTLAVVVALLAALFFLPRLRGWGFAVARARWCRSGFWVLLVYLAATGYAHHAALERVEAFAAAQGQHVDAEGAIPLPPSLLSWRGLVRTPDGVYQARFSLADRQPPAFRFLADAPGNRFTAEALELPAVQTYLRFARFPTLQYRQRGDENIVELFDLRFYSRPRRGPQPFTYRLVFDPGGRLLQQGWALE